MSNFICEHCGTSIIDSPKGYITGCEHYPIKSLSKAKQVKKIFISKEIETMSLVKFEKNEKLIFEQIKQGLIK